MKTGFEYPGAVFLKLFAHRPGVIRKATRYPAKDPKTGATVVYTKVFDQDEGVYRFEDSESQKLECSKVVSDA
eukprot:13729852-Alexandrium_andersonii.AAC.1